jgi:trimethylamine--corrinoid protein Co-methyltransferase
MQNKYKDRETGYSVLTKNDLDMLHEATLDFMEDFGVNVYGDEAHEYFEGAGCEVDREESRIRFPRNLVNDCIESTPGERTMYARDPAKDVPLGEGYVSYTNFGVGTTLLDPYTGERNATTLEDLANITRFMDAVDEVDQISPAVSATDKHDETRELHEAIAIFNNTSKHFAHDTEGKENTETFIKMAAVVAGGMDKLRERPIVSLGCCPNSPLEIFEDASDQIIVSAKAGIPFEVLSMGLSGGTTPVTLAGTLLSTNCEILAGIVLGQIVNKGLSMTYGSSTTIMDMRMATTPVGAPEHAMIGAAVAQIGRYYDIPTEAGGT